MNGTPAIYLGQIVEKAHFRTFIYSPDGSQKLVESWDEYEKHMESGVWFATRDDAQNSKPKRVRTPAKPKPPMDEPQVHQDEQEVVEVNEDVEPLVADKGTFEVTNDDFLPSKARK